MIISLKMEKLGRLDRYPYDCHQMDRMANADRIQDDTRANSFLNFVR